MSLCWMPKGVSCIRASVLTRILTRPSRGRLSGWAVRRLEVSNRLTAEPLNRSFASSRIRRHQLRQCRTQLRISRRIDFPERRGAISDLAVLAHYKERAVVELVLGVECAGCLSFRCIRIARERERILGIAGP